MDWFPLLVGLGIGIVAGFFLCSLLTLSRENGKEAELNFYRHKIVELERRRGC